MTATTPEQAMIKQSWNWFAASSKQSITLPQSRITTDQHLILENQSQDYFLDNKLGQANDLGVLSISIHQAFDPEEISHLEFIAKCTAEYNKSANKLMYIDAHTCSYFVLSIVLPWVPIVGFLSTLAMIATGYYISQRGAAYNEQQALAALLAKACNWSLGANVNPNIMSKPEIKDMLKALVPILEKKELNFLIDNAYEADAAVLGDHTDSPLVGTKMSAILSHGEIDYALKTSLNFTLCLYGLNKGDFMSICSAVLTAIPDLFKLIIQRIQKYMQPEPVVVVDADPNPNPNPNPLVSTI